jgi:hypothetical protein
LRAHLDADGIAYRIFVIEQEATGLFNRGRLINIGAAYAADASDYFCLHDVDAVPQVANYQCPSQPLRLVATIVTEHRRTTRPSYYFSGAISIRKEQLWRANGYSNEYWGWGKEDDDLFFRLLLAGYLCFFDTQGEFLDLPNPRTQQVTRAKFKKPPHLRRNRRRRSRLLRGLSDPMEDGLSTLRYEVTAQEARDGYEYVRVRW